MNSSSKGYKRAKRSSKIARRKRSQPIIGFKSSSSRPNQIKFFQFKSIFNTSIKSRAKYENLVSFISKLNNQEHTSPKQHYQNDNALIVVDCNDADIGKVKAQELHSNKTY